MAASGTVWLASLDRTLPRFETLIETLIETMVPAFSF